MLKFLAAATLLGLETGVVGGTVLSFSGSLSTKPATPIMASRKASSDAASVAKLGLWRDSSRPGTGARA